ncbi:uncharacterized protein PHACADRAFT_247433 [Phanerochaete carnosa HHB-10118-sp]|uniref:Uncharacterized protein n=1 Tax=Phanerochaete carnosa (strain HHB-10118-sp) TaxID=650164 RepID=K5WPB4_PHACS|nr:uncharacterized protein PHACADRAFT_247433 [Phanerochaete carnosa HHB-10118-sp]EKM61074.1 hypothetical protein PHACADRAFT_247433 [Phanerochaete carnosa HHB-10118-sp]
MSSSPSAPLRKKVMLLPVALQLARRGDLAAEEAGEVAGVLNTNLAILLSPSRCHGANSDIVQPHNLVRHKKTSTA